MKHLILVLLGVIGICYTTQTFAQSYNDDITIETEKIIIDDQGNESETTIEIKNGKLFIDGKKVTDIDKNTEVKIVKKNTTSEVHSFNFNEMDSPFTPSIKKMFGSFSRKAILGVMPKDDVRGVKISKIIPESGAEKAGLEEGDYIREIDGVVVNSAQELIDKISKYEKGDEVEVRIRRHNKEHKIYATLQEPKQNAMSMEHHFNRIPSRRLEDVFNLKKGEGLRIASINSPLPKIGIEIEEGENCLKVLSVKPNGPAAKAGIQKNDVIQKIENKNVDGIRDLRNALMSNRNNKKINVQIQRKGALKTLPVMLSRAKKRAKF